MHYLDLNLKNKKWAESAFSHTDDFRWEDDKLMNYLIGELPAIRYTQEDSKVPEILMKLRSEYNKYNFLHTNKVDFLTQIKTICDEIHSVSAYWSGLYFSTVEEIVNMHKSCMLFGEGGIGKSYFIKCLEEKLEEKSIKHLCLYGKLCKKIKDIDFEQISEIAKTEEFVFVFDAINEIDNNEQKALLEKLKSVNDFKGMRFIITYRSNMLDKNVLLEYEQFVNITYRFPGVSFESAIEWMQKDPAIDIDEYLDVLYSNNPLILGTISAILKNEIDKKSVIRFTHIFEHCIKDNLPIEVWRDTKKVARFLYKNNKKVFSMNEISSFVTKPTEYVSEMEMKGLIVRIWYDATEAWTFENESLADYLIARTMLEELNKSQVDICIETIKNKISTFNDLDKEALILVVFDKFAPDYNLLKEILVKTNLIAYFDYETIIKLHFTAEEANDFLKVFKPTKSNDLIAFFSGLVNKPFNCINYLNNYYLSDKKHILEISRNPPNKYMINRLKGRLKNILYHICKCDCKKERIQENFYTAIWNSAHCNSDIRNLALKILFEIIQRNFEFVETAIDLFGKIDDDYIREAIIYALSSQKKDDKIKSFFEIVFLDYDFIDAKSIKRIAIYLNNKNGYINTSKKNLYLFEDKSISKEFRHILYRVDLFEKEMLPFRIYDLDKPQSLIKFLKTDKNEISKYNLKLAKEFACVKEGACCGTFVFQENVEKIYSVTYRNELLDGKAFLKSFEKVFRAVFEKYEMPFNTEEASKIDHREFNESLFRKCVDISIDKFYGSLMCNYYSKEFITYNGYDDFIGYEVYDPLRYKENIKIKTPLSVFSPEIEKINDLLIAKLELPQQADELWWRDSNLARKNILSLLEPIIYKDKEWILLSARISLKDKPEDYTWQDNYDIYVCCSDNETLKGDGNERYLTIELESYEGNLFEYEKNEEFSWLCKKVDNIEYDSDLFDQTWLVLPPSDMIADLKLQLDAKLMCWFDNKKDPIIFCNNNKASYYRDVVMGTTFIRKDAFEKLKKTRKIKYFSFTERRIEDKGFSEEVDFHYEIIEGEIKKAYPNGVSENNSRETFDKCENCKYGFYTPNDGRESLEDIIIKFGYGNKK